MGIRFGFFWLETVRELLACCSGLATAARQGGGIGPSEAVVPRWQDTGAARVRSFGSEPAPAEACGKFARVGSLRAGEVDLQIEFFILYRFACT